MTRGVCAAARLRCPAAVCAAPPCLLRGRAQAYKLYSTAAVQLDRPGGVQAARSVDNVLASALRFLGFVSRVERNAAPPTLTWVLDGEALARYVSFSLTVRCVAWRAWPQPRAVAR